MVTLKTMPIKVLDNSFHYVLHTRRASVRYDSTLQTYCNVLTLKRRKETDPEVRVLNCCSYYSGCIPAEAEGVQVPMDDS